MRRKKPVKRQRRTKLSSKSFRNFVLREARKLQKEAALSGKIEDVSKIKAKEYKPGEEADTLEKDIDFIKALKIKENKIRRQHKRMKRQMKQIQERKRRLRAKILKNI
tara:strand:+ start:223 stop:546 length:324 start_codon:yes stop_codon:yes gene_type:complete